jgi:hypothetical protein
VACLVLETFDMTTGHEPMSGLFARLPVGTAECPYPLIADRHDEAATETCLGIFSKGPLAGLGRRTGNVVDLFAGKEARFHQLAEVPPALTWFANIDNPQTRRACQNDVQEFMRFAGIEDPQAFRQVGRGQGLA